MQESPVLLDFRANKKPPVDKISFINRWYLIWCGQQDSNLHGFPLEPKSSVSANSTMSAFTHYNRTDKLSHPYLLMCLR